MADLKKRFPWYSRLLKLYPPAYRAQYGNQMLQTLADMLDTEPGRKRIIWLRTVIDLPLSLIRQQLSYAGGIMTQQMPSYVKPSAAISAGMILPFVVVLLANGLDKVINGHTLESSWLWHMPTLAIWVLWLPAAACVLALVSLFALTLQRRKATQKSLLKQFLDFHYNWPLVVTGLAGLCIVAMVVGHDSVHCITGNPVRELHNPHQTWQCIQQR